MNVTGRFNAAISASQNPVFRKRRLTLSETRSKAPPGPPPRIGEQNLPREGRRLAGQNLFDRRRNGIQRLCHLVESKPGSPCRPRYAALVGARRNASVEANHGPFSDGHRVYSGMLGICIGDGCLAGMARLAEVKLTDGWKRRSAMTVNRADKCRQRADECGTC